MKKIAIFLLMFCLCLTGCSDTQNNNDKQLSETSVTQADNVTIEVDEDKSQNYNLVNVPSEAYVIECLKRVPDIEEVVGDCLDDNTTHREGCIGLIYFSSNLINQEDVYGDTVEEKGTDCGGSVEIFKDEESATARDEYLKGFDDSWLFYSGYHTVVGTLVIRTSKELTEEEQKKLETSIIEILISGEVEEPVITVPSTTATPETSTTTSDIVDNKIQVPSASYMCEGKHYSEIIKLFEDAGFTNVNAVSYEVDYNKETSFEGCVVIVSINDDAIFEADARYEPNATVSIKYVVAPTETQPTVTTTVTTTTPYIPPSSSNVGNGGNSVTVPDYEENDGNLVWVPVNGGTKYHSRAGCSNMEDPMQVTKETAIANGYTACGRCY